MTLVLDERVHFGFNMSSETHVVADRRPYLAEAGCSQLLVVGEGMGRGSEKT
jgi:hypothetical protein